MPRLLVTYTLLLGACCYQIDLGATVPAPPGAHEAIETVLHVYGADGGTPAVYWYGMGAWQCGPPSNPGFYGDNGDCDEGITEWDGSHRIAVMYPQAGWFIHNTALAHELAHYAFGAEATHDHPVWLFGEDHANGGWVGSANIILEAHGL
jgi:hypothetical protein